MTRRRSGAVLRKMGLHSLTCSYLTPSMQFCSLIVCFMEPVIARSLSLTADPTPQGNLTPATDPQLTSDQVHRCDAAIEPCKRGLILFTS